MYRNLLALPSSLTEAHLLPLRPYATHILSVLLDAQIFHVLPECSLRPYNPSDLPREYFVEDDVDPATVLNQPSTEATTSTVPKKKGRPGKREKTKRAREALGALDKWLDKNTYTYTGTPDSTKTTHTLISHPPTASRAIYTMQKTEMLDVLDPSSRSPFGLGPVAASVGQTGAEPLIDPGLVGSTNPGRGALVRANNAVVSRLRKSDEMAAEQGLEVGGEGGEMTGLTRVERAVGELHEGRSRGGILNMLEGAGVYVPPLPPTIVGTQRVELDEGGGDETRSGASSGTPHPTAEPPPSSLPADADTSNTPHSL